MKKVISLVLLIILLSGCSTDYPWERANVWYCEELDLILTFTEEPTGVIITDITPLIWMGQTYDASIGFSKCGFGFIHDPDDDGVSEIIVSGSWFYEKGNLIFTDFGDSEFFNPYEKLVFVPHE